MACAPLGQGLGSHLTGSPVTLSPIPWRATLTRRLIRAAASDAGNQMYETAAFHRMSLAAHPAAHRGHQLTWRMR